MRHRNYAEDYRLVEMPGQLRRLAEDLLTRHNSIRARRRESPITLTSGSGLSRNGDWLDPVGDRAPREFDLKLCAFPESGSDGNFASVAFRQMLDDR